MRQLRLFFLLAVCMVSLHALSDDAVEIDGIYYNLVNKIKQAEVTKNPNNYTGSVVIPASVSYDGVEYIVTSIGDRAFSDCTGLTSVTIPNSVTSIGSSAFWGCTGLTSITIPNSVTSIGSSAFWGCTGLTSITIPNSVTSIGYQAFCVCTSLTSVTIPNSVTSIGYQAFCGCTSLTSITIPNSVTSIGSSAFRDCTSLTSVTIPNSVTSIGEYAFYGCSSLTSVTIGNSVTSIGNNAFQGCSSLTSVTIGNSVTFIGNSAFQGCSDLTFLSIGSGIKTIYEYAFAYCPELTDVYCHAENVPEMKGEYYPYNPCTNAFEGSYIECATLHVPTASTDAYKAVEPWKSFKTIIGLDGTTPETPKCATPTISFGGKKLSFDCETEGVEYVTEIKDADVGMFYDDKIALSATYEISVFATKAGYENSDKATATLVWTNATFTDTTPLTAINHVQSSHAMPVLIQSNKGTVTVQGADDGTQIGIYTVAGIQAGSAVSNNGSAIIHTDLQAGSVAIVKIGDKAVKILIK